MDPEPDEGMRIEKELLLEDIYDLIRAVSEIECDEIDLSVGDVRIVVRRNTDRSVLDAEVEGPGERAVVPPVVASPVAGRAESVDPEPTRESAGSAKGAPEELLEREAEGNIHLVRSPMVGTVYRAREPGAAPFVEVGTGVDAATVVCLVEVMKLFHSVEAGREGRVSQILFDDGEVVERGQPLVVIDLDQE